MKLNIGKFLSTFAVRTGTGVYVNHGVNESNLVSIEHVVDVVVTQGADTLSLTLPAHLDPEYVPLSLIVWGNEDPIRLAINNGVITSHNKDTGVTVLTPVTTTWAVGDTVVLTYGLATLGA